MNFSRTLKSAALSSLIAVAAFGALGCSSASSEGEEETQALATSRTSIGLQTKAFAGSFRVALDEHDVKWEFDVSRIDWTNHTARWDAKVVDRDGHPTATDDVNIDLTITMARCLGCFRFSGSDSNGPLVDIQVSASQVAGLTYVGESAATIRISSVTAANSASAGEGANGDGDDSSITGSCTRICGGGPYGCKSSLTRAQCNVDAFEDRVRCPSTFDFKAGGLCE